MSASSEIRFHLMLRSEATTLKKREDIGMGIKPFGKLRLHYQELVVGK